MTLRDLICNALNTGYFLEQAAADLGGLMFERDLVKRKGDTDSPRLHELERLIPLQQTLALRKLRGDGISDRLAQLGIRVENA